MDESHHWFQRGVALYEKGDYSGAITAFDKAIEIDPSIAEAWNNRGLALVQTGQYRESLESFNKTLSLKPDHENALKAKKIVLKLLGNQKNTEKVPASLVSKRGGSL